MQILKLKPIFKDYIWGGKRLKDDFGFDTGFEKTAEGWMLACHKDGMNIIDGGEYDGAEDYYETDPEDDGPPWDEDGEE